MTEAEISTIGKLADMCRAKGVRVLDVPGSIHLELEQVHAPMSTKPAVDPDVCRCGHPEHAHMNGLCIHACEPEKCVEQSEAS
mgnify:FL=1